ncbi:Prolyl oligopeptidase family protein [Paenibacillus tianmuensis]|uniref:Prolyl oligopeptidase family protein n=1 Tax=Paenibacillus tianmuensis TaxID=624147 RepID=A0A1G4T357_9BACL|nr:prolyl oligopeptidase family serine peptidase [Paenibacillus tianmuensis]SCW75843.1 Prolyl oligopeptidase family protein [Paenibacillus tianmuensis]
MPIPTDTNLPPRGLTGGVPADGTLVQRESLRSLAKGISLFRLTYISQGLQVKGYLAVPDAIMPVPGLIYCRGGIRKVGMVRKRRIFSMARRGYAVFAPFYRGNEGGEGREDFGGEDRFDVHHAITLMQSLPEVQSGLVPLIGFSRGALMALLAAKECEGAGLIVVWGGVSDLLDTYEERVDLRRMLKRVVGHPRKQAECYERRSPVCWVDAIRVPVMIVHGTADVQVSVEQARKLGAALERAGKEYKMELYDGLGHRFPKEDDERALDAIFGWITSKRERVEVRDR